MPDVIANLRVDQAWGFAGVSVAIHDASGAYYGTGNNVNNGHPADKLGWAFAVGGLLNLPGGDQAGINFAYSEGAAGYATNIGTGMQMYNASTSVGVGWLTDGVFDTGTEIQLTRVWSINAAYQHIWNAKWKTSWFGGYVNVSYNDAAKNIINSHLPGAAGSIQCDVPVAGAVFPPIGMTAGGTATAAVPTSASSKSALARSGTRCRSSISVSKCSTRTSTPRIRASATYSGERLTTGGHLHRRPEHLVRDVPLAAQLLSMICCSIVATSEPPAGNRRGLCFSP